MKIDWKRKLTSRKFWAAVCGFVSMLILALGRDAGTAQTVTGMIMAAGSLIAYIIGEGLADAGGSEPIVEYKMADPTEYNPFESCAECKITYTETEGKANGVSES